MRYLCFSLLMVITLAPNKTSAQEAAPFDSTLLYNNKESLSRELSTKDFNRALLWAEFEERDEDLTQGQSKQLIKETMSLFTNRQYFCELYLSDLMSKKAIERGLIGNEREFPAYLNYLRATNLIDDIFFKILSQSYLISNDLKNLRETNSVESSRYSTRGYDLKKIYGPFQNWPDETNRCVLGTYRWVVRNLPLTNTNNLSEQIGNLNDEAFKNDIITEETFIKLEILRNRKVHEWPVSLSAYLEVVKNSKDKLAKVRETQPASNFSEQFVSRKEKLTQRGRLYKFYDSTQIIMLASLIEKTAKRMDARRVTLSFEYEEEFAADNEIYVLSPMEQYRISIKLLRKEMAEIMRSENFKGMSIEYEDLISAAYETGMIRAEELQFILKFEEFWDPKKAPKWKTYANFTFSLMGSASFYLPPPWNVIGAMGLVLTQSTLLKDKETPDSDNNWNVII